MIVHKFGIIVCEIISPDHSKQIVAKIWGHAYNQQDNKGLLKGFCKYSGRAILFASWALEGIAQFSKREFNLHY